MSDAVARLDAALEGRYAIERQLGEGGMATVYLADDLRHDRKVALKVLKPDLAAAVGAERFLAEIKTTAHLQHPHILPLFDSGEADGLVFYVMPYVEGETLRNRLEREKQLPVEEAVRIATEVAEALQAAHEQDVIHRDIKPANILLSRDRPIVADFGIALAVNTAAGHRLTETGLSVGTPHYMSPEQATGDQTVGPATDTWALGCVLYEMLVGEPPYTGATAQAILGKIIAGEPVSATAQRNAVPANVDAAIAKALEKLPADRFSEARDFAKALGDTAFRHGDVSKAGIDTGLRFGSVVTVALVMTGLAAWGWLRSAGGPNALPVVRSAFLLPQDQLLEISGRAPLAISSDGLRIVYVGEQAGETQLYVRDLEQFGTRIIPGTDGGRQPFLSPDGESVGFFAGGMLKKVSIAGGIPIELAQVATPGGGSWGEDGTILYSSGAPSLWRVAEDGGTPDELLIVTPASEGGGGASPESLQGLIAIRPHLLPGGRHALVGIGTTTVVLDLDTGEARRLAARRLPRSVDGRGFTPVADSRYQRAQFVQPGYIAFYGGAETVSVVPFSIESLEVTGPEIPLVDDALRPAGSRSIFAVSESGTLVYATGGFDRQLVIVDPTGREVLIDIAPRGYRFPSVSPDGNWVAVTVDPQPPQIWMVDLRRENAQPLTTDGYNLAAGWSPNGTRLAWVRQQVDPPGLHWVRWPEGGEFTFITTGNRAPFDWARDDEMFIRGGDWDIALIDLGVGTEEEFVATTAIEGYPRVSPDGKWVAYMSDVTGSPEIYVLPSAANSAPQLVSNGGGTEPRWSRDGTELIYRNGTSMWTIDVRTLPDFQVTGVPQLLFSEPYDFSNDNNWDLLPDGRFVMVKSNPNVRREIRLVVNFHEELRRRMPN